MSAIPEPEPARPWRPEDGPSPEVWTWPRSDRPTLKVWSAGAWRYASVMARQNWSDGSVYYQVEVDLRGDTTIRTCLYRWPQPGLKAARKSTSEPSRGVDERWQGNMPQGPRRA
ncbi:hypothetical protein ACIHJG_35985 [Streptomyces sp. NPDC052415]|uniref:hypothetical protein n=1 Tax=Streptomyces sp. NPDC052415 TaxID=3365690 RepID=UPI0037D112D7